MMKCVFCKGSLVKKMVEEEVKAGNDHILAEVEAEVCVNCHERYFPQGTIDYLQKLKKELKNKKEQFKPVGQVFRAA
ncbi:MAG: hypothetical protein A2W61_07350 [Deltaproteobacteria bacterium RIFCSPLOWO2_01_44_7]|nr:MAG: hypothetical protein A2712_08005 [Deltaproteobacteria bacterium RIFCSPHIGHO2_01_FULL_43_49]OGQ14831.1 MAG: hypothetical protein A3D22_08995 [Deltaproteobacteria bacterium RIFCSPHIGHO2_02_FULL_44_53]OGQ28217.1 MAG: hypothetical protein A3D98_07705 [Deltaproteobacteria bacterium RIFCSPHIGHO2_12_FULL_44_21]OGQ31429.1 MAG: hypothetical protein A2979_07755 [Deltaproteobacteria bacterium RIFCSPLOWO2_01_FULL_45_74]OGQ40811.1 MAG: hypothetical protein A2W61_07350 [Deltaproteobacteria bacterium 